MNHQEILDTYRLVAGTYKVDSPHRLTFLLRLVQEHMRSAPWYPDDSGEWIEHTPGEDPGLDPEQVVFFLLRREREEERYIETDLLARHLDFGVEPGDHGSEIVAYKLAK